MPHDIQGIIPALLTPFDLGGNVNFVELRRFTAFLIAQGCHGLFVCGSAGEGFLQSLDERKRVAETVVEEVGGRVPIIVHVGAMSTRDAVELASHAQQIHAAAVSTLPPFYYHYPWKSVIEFVNAVAQASKLPTFYYHVPVISRVNPSVEEFLEMADNVDGFAGFKFTSLDLFQMWAVLDARPRLRILYGCDQQLYQGLLTGAHGAVGSTYNYQCADAVKLYDAVLRGNHGAAQQLQWRINQVVRVMFRFGGSRAAEKTIASLLGFDLGAPRPPNLPFPTDQLLNLKRALEEISFL